MGEVISLSSAGTAANTVVVGYDQRELNPSHHLSSPVTGRSSLKVLREVTSFSAMSSHRATSYKPGERDKGPTSEVQFHQKVDNQLP